MPSVYLQSSDYATYGVPNATAAQVIQACTMIDAFLDRPEGLIYVPDADGAPSYMQNLSPASSNISLGSISPGVNVNVPVSGNLGVDLQGYVVILDRGNSSMEACSIVSVTGSVIQLANVKFSHNVATKLEFGMTIFETRNMPKNRPLFTVLRKTPIVNFISGRGRYAYTRRGNEVGTGMTYFNMLAVYTQFGGPPLWEVFDSTRTSINLQTGECWVPAGILLAYYTEVQISYVAGWTYQNLPSGIKQAAATLVGNLALNPTGVFTKMTAGGTSLQRASASNMDLDTQSLLLPYSARSFS